MIGRIANSRACSVLASILGIRVNQVVNDPGMAGIAKILWRAKKQADRRAVERQCREWDEWLAWVRRQVGPQ